MRHTPQMSDHWITWAHSTPLVLMGNETGGEGQHWLQARDSKDDVGWIPAQFVTR